MAKAKIKRRKSSVSAREKRVRRARAARHARREAQFDRELDRRYRELFDADTPPERAAALWLERLDGDPVPVEFSRVLAVGTSVERVEELSATMDKLAPDSVPALTFAADIGFQLRSDASRASALIDRALEQTIDAARRMVLADHLLALGRAAEALEIVEQRLLDIPEDENAQHVQAGALGLAHRRIVAGEPAPDSCPCSSGRSWTDCCRAAEERALERFADRSGLYRLRAAMRRFTASAPDVDARIAEDVERWMREADEFDRHVEARERLMQVAVEHAWLVGSDDAEDDADAPLALFASSRSAAPDEAAAASRWLAHCTYGLWQICERTPAPGVWMVDLVTSTRRYVAIPPEQLEGIGRWSVLLGALGTIDGTWRTAGTLVPLRPSEADTVAELAEEMMYDVVSAAAGKEIKRARPDRQEPAGVLAARAEPASPEVTAFFSKVLGSGMPQLLALVGELRNRTPDLRNTDKEPMCLINAVVEVTDAAAAADGLAGHSDFEYDGDELTWWGRELDELERATTAAEVRAMLRERGEDPSALVNDGPQRWLRGRIKPREDGFEVDVNSRERLERFLELLRGFGQEPVVSEKLVIDPAQDLALPSVGALLTLGGGSEEANAAWLAHFADQPLPALDGHTPRQASRRQQYAPRLEALLRELEHDADILVSRGMQAPDIDRLRQELDAPAAAWL